MPCRFPASYTLFDRLAALWDRVRPGRVLRRRPTRLAVEAIEDRLVPTGTPTVWLDSAYQSLPEGMSGGVWVYRSGGDTSQPLTVNLSVGPDEQGDAVATWGVDYTVSGPSGGGSGGSWAALGASGGTVTFGAYASSVYLGVDAQSDTLAEPTEGFRISVQPGASYAAGSGGSSGGSGGSTVADVRVTDVWAGSGGSGGLIVDASGGGTPGGSGGSGGSAVVWMGPASQELGEGASGGVWVYRSGGDTTQPLTVNLSIGPDGSGDPLAAWDADYTLTGPAGSGGSGGGSVLGATGGTVTFATGQTAVYLAAQALTDSAAEPTEGFRLAVQTGSGYLAGTGGASGGSATADVRVADDWAGSGASGGTSGGSGGTSPAVVWLDAAPVTLAEGESDGLWAYRAGGMTSQPLTVNVSFGGNAEGDPLAAWGEDYTFFQPSGGSGGGWSGGSGGATFAFGANETAIYLGIQALTDTSVEPTEAARLALQPGGGYEVGFGAGPPGPGWVTAVDVRIADATAVLPSSLMVRADQAGEWIRRLSAPGKEITTAPYLQGSDYVRLVLPDADRNQADHDRIRDVFVQAGLRIGDTTAPVQEALNAIYRGAILNPPGYGDRFIVFNHPDGLAQLFMSPVAAATPSNLLVRAHQAGEWVRLLSAPGKLVTTVLNGSNSDFVRLVLPDAARTDADHTRLAAAFSSQGVPTAGSPSALDEVVRAIYRGAVLNPPGYTDRYLVLDPEEGKSYVSQSGSFGSDQISPDISRIPLERVDEMVAAGLAREIDGFVYVAWLDAPNRRLHKVILERFRTVQQVVYANESGAEYTDVDVSARGIPRQAGHFFRAVSHLDVTYTDPHQEMYDRAMGEPSARTFLNALLARREAGQADAFWSRVEFAIHATPILSTAGYLQAGDYKEAAIGALGDVTLAFGVGMWVKGAQATRATRFALLATTAAEVGVAAYRVDQGFNDLANGDRMVAAGRFAEAGLRLIGITPGIAAYLKAAGRGKLVAAEAEAAVAEVRAATAYVGGAGARQTTLDGLPNARNLTPAHLQGSEATCGLHSAASVIDDVVPNRGPLKLGNVQDEIVLNGGAGLNEYQLVKFLDDNLPNGAAVTKLGQTEDQFLGLLTQGQVIAGTDGNHWVRVLGVVQDGGRTWVRVYDPARGNYEQLLSSFMTRVFRPNQPAEACNVFILVRTGG